MKRAWAFLVLATVAGSPVWAQQKIDQIVARVNGDIVLKSEVDRELDLRRIEMAQQGMDAARINLELAEQSKIVLRDLIDRALLLQIAKEAGLSADLDVQKTLEELRVERKFATLDDLEKAIKKDYGDFEEFKNDIRVKYLTQQVIEHEVYGRSRKVAPGRAWYPKRRVFCRRRSRRVSTPLPPTISWSVDFPSHRTR